MTYLHADALGSSSFTSDETGSASLRRVVYRPFGEAVDPGASGGTSPPQLGFTGQRLEADLGLYDYGARWVDPALGRFLQPDALAPTYDPQGFNPYAYVRNDPVNRVDPSGNCSREIFSFCFQFSFGFSSINGPSTLGGFVFGTCGLGGRPVRGCGSFGQILRSLGEQILAAAQGQICAGGFSEETICIGEGSGAMGAVASSESVASSPMGAALLRARSMADSMSGTLSGVAAAYREHGMPDRARVIELLAADMAWSEEEDGAEAAHATSEPAP